MTADLVLYNANVLTLDSKYPGAQLVAIRGGKVLAVGESTDLKEFKGSRTLIIDCQGGTVLPGFNDAHCHFAALAKSLVNLNLGPAKVRSIPDIQREVGKLAQNLPRGTWIRADGYNEFYLREKRHPTRWDLDRASSVHPIKLTHRSGHAHVLNSLNLRVALLKETWKQANPMVCSTI
jgi:predicted amidohydrolase YtcJ